MTDRPLERDRPWSRKTALDKDLRKITRLERATAAAGRSSTKLGLGLMFLLAVWGYALFMAGGLQHGAFVVLAAVIGGYMALNIGANDVANNVGPTVGSRALTMAGALVIAIVFEAAGAIIAGGDVIATVSKGIVDPSRFGEAQSFVLAMTSALLAAAVWVNLATWANAPVSTTHSVVGAVAGAGVAALGADAVNWAVMAQIAASWVISPLIGGVVAAGFLAVIEFAVLRRRDRVAAARRWVPILVAVMAAIFASYLMMKGLKRVWNPDAPVILAIAGVVFVATQLGVKAAVDRAAHDLVNRRSAIANLFTIPLVVSAALLSFAHGANDVANAVGPLAAIIDASSNESLSAEVAIPLWVMLVGALGISVGLALFGPKLIRTVGSRITRLDRARAFAIALSAAMTVIVASALGLPVSSTHIALGALFGVGFLREELDRRRRHRKMDIADALAAAEDDAEDTGFLIEEEPPSAARKRKKKAKKARKRKLVRRRHLLTILAAWLITVPLSGLLAAGLFAMLQALPLR